MSLPCNICGKRLASLFGLMEHKRIHTGDRPYVCQVCQKRFTQKAHLVIHKRTHTGEKPYACHICHKRFAQSSHLNNHKRIHTGEKPYFCNMCNLGFSRKQRLELHVLQHAQQQTNNTSNSTNSNGNNNNTNNSNNNTNQTNPEDVNSTFTNNSKTLYTPEVESIYSRTIMDSSQTQISISPSQIDPSLQNLNFSHRRKPAYVTRVSNEDYEGALPTNFEAQAVTDQEEVNTYSLSTNNPTQMKSEPKEYEEYEVISNELDSLAQHNMGAILSSENMLTHSLGGTDPLDQDIRDQSKGLEDSIMVQVEGSGHHELTREVHSSSDPDMGSICAVSTTDVHHVTSGDDGDDADGASITSESNNSNGVSNRLILAKRSMLGHPMLKVTNPNPHSQNQGLVSRQRMGIPHKMTVSTSMSATSSTVSRPGNRLTLLDFSTEELLAHLMMRDDAYRCDFCCLLFQDAAMYHLHRSMHDKIDCRCCNICGKLSKDKHDFIAHFLSEHK